MTAMSRRDIRQPAAAPRRGWLVVADQELRDLWLSARGPGIVLAFSLLLSFLAYLAATNKDLNIVDQRDTVNLMVQLTLGIGVAASLLVSADALSGERERETLEGLLLAPLPRRQIVLGKFVAAVSIWPLLMIVAIPYIWVLARGLGIVRETVLVTLFTGSLLTVAFAALGMIVSVFSNSNRLSLAVSFFVFIALAAPTQLTFKGWLGGLLDRANPVTAAAEYARRIIVRGSTFGQNVDWLWSPGVAAVLGLIALILIAGQLRLRGGLRG